MVVTQESKHLKTLHSNRTCPVECILLGHMLYASHFSFVEITTVYSYSKHFAQKTMVFHPFKPKFIHYGFIQRTQYSSCIKCNCTKNTQKKQRTHHNDTFQAINISIDRSRISECGVVLTVIHHELETNKRDR